MKKILCIAGFGDDASMFAPLVEAAAGGAVQFHPVNLPGFGAPALPGASTTLHALATDLAAQANALGAEIVLAHSVASVIASIAVSLPRSPLTSILSLEGNLTPEDAYFSGTAAQYANAATFRTAFLARLDEMAGRDPVLARYRQVVTQADPHALWDLGCDAHQFSQTHSPGDWLQNAPRATYLFNPDNLPPSSLAWLAAAALPRLELPDASHWASVDQPHLLAKAVDAALQLWAA